MSLDHHSENGDSEDEDFGDSAIMHKYKVHTVLVVDKDNHLKGIVDHYACMV